MNFVLHGYAVSGGITVGYAHLVSTARLEVAHYEVAPDAIDAELARAQHQVVGIVLPPHRQGQHLLLRAAEDLARAGEHGGADLAVRDEQHADHLSLLISTYVRAP